MAVRTGGAFGTIDRAAVACAWPPGREWPTTWDQFRVGRVVVAAESRLARRQTTSRNWSTASTPPAENTYRALTGT